MQPLYQPTLEYHRMAAGLSLKTAWQNLKKHFNEIQNQQMRELFRTDPDRFKAFSLQFEDILLDYSKNRINTRTVELLMQLAQECGLEERRSAMFTGEKINNTEDRAVLHTALRNRSAQPVYVDGEDVMPFVRAELDHMREFTEQVRTGIWRGYTGKQITDVVNIGIGGSDLGARMVCETLAPYRQPGLKTHFVSNVDGTHITEVVRRLNPETCLFVIASKTFTTQETMTNANTAREWFLTSVSNTSAVAKHFVAVSTNTRAVEKFGIDPANMFRFWDWVGGRYSLWSVVGMPIALSIGMDQFDELLEGAYAMDQHFQNAELTENLPVILAMLGVWYHNFHAADTHAILPYDQYMDSFVDYLQQLDMESNGKSVTLDGDKVDYDTGPVLWGRAGTNGQHAFYQLIHQGTRLVPCDFIAPVETHNPVGDHHKILLANYFAQPEALMQGRSEDQARAMLEKSGLAKDEIEARLPHVIFSGNRPSNSILFKKMTPRTLGSILALYEHKVFVQGVIWQVDSFDQWGVELGKILATTVLAELHDDNTVASHDSSTNGLINYYKSLSSD